MTTLRIYFEEDRNLIQSSIDLLVDIVFDHWTVKPSIEIEKFALYYDNEICVKIEYINNSLPSQQYFEHLNQASDLTFAFINGYIEGFKAK
jgi:hypothetical protein